MVLAAYISRLDNGRFFGSFADIECIATGMTLEELHNNMLTNGRSVLLKRNFRVYPTKNPVPVDGYEVHWYSILRREDIPNV